MTMKLALLTALLLCVGKSQPFESCQVGDIMYPHGNSIGYLANSCYVITEGDNGNMGESGQQSFCVNGQIISTPYQRPCYDPSTSCCQTGPPGQPGAAVCINPDTCVPVSVSVIDADAVPDVKDMGGKGGDVMEVYGIAEFTGDVTGVTGEITVDENGNVVVNLDLNDLDYDRCEFPADTQASYLYHIHETWNTDDLTERIDCTADIVGSHYDPFGTGLTCESLKVDYEMEPDYFNCEIGDLSGRFGQTIQDASGYIFAEGNISYMPSSGKKDGFCGLRLTPEQVYKRSVVVHCNDLAKTKLFCAPFQVFVYDEGRGY